MNDGRSDFLLRPADADPVWARSLTYNKRVLFTSPHSRLKTLYGTLLAKKFRSFLTLCSLDGTTLNL